jgi:hypothetical protein
MEKLPKQTNSEAQQVFKPIRWKQRLAMALAGLLCAGVLAVVGWLTLFRLAGDRWKATQLPDVSQPIDLTIAGDGPIHGIQSMLTIHIIGELDGEAALSIEDRDPYRLKGQVNFRTCCDWYSSRCTLHYRPIGKVSGKLVIHYRFR